MGILRVDKISGLEKERRQNPNLVANGDFSDSSIAGWTGYNAVVSHDSGAGGRIKVDDSAGAGGWSNAAYVVNTEPGASYRFEVRASATDSDTQFVGYYQGTYDTAGTAPTVYSSEITTTPSVHYFNLIATGTTVTIMLIANNNGVVYFDDVSFRKTDGNSIGGSVHFDGTDDYLSLASSTDFALGTDDWTVEWFAYPTSSTQYQRHFYLEGGSATTIDGIFANPSGIAFGRTNAWATSETPHPLNQWNHYALVHDSTNMRLYLNGVEVLTTTNDFGTDATKSLNIGYSNSTYGGYFTGNISNFRILRGTALYTSNFTVPTHALEVIGDTVLLCCNNSDSAGAEATGKTITANGDPTVSTDNPSLTRDFTSGTEFRGVTTFDTQGYFVPPSGTTEQRGAGKALFGGGYIGPTRIATIESVNINTFGSATKFGTLKANTAPTSTSSATRQIFAGGYSPGVTDNIDYVTIASSSDSVDFGTLTTARRDFAGLSNSIRSVFGGGTTTGSTTPTDNMEFLTTASLGQSTPFGTLTVSGRSNAACASPTRGIFFGGYRAYTTPISTYTNAINYITIATTGSETDFGDLATDYSGGKGGHAAFSNSTRGVVGGGAIYGPNAPLSTYYTTMEYVTIASTGSIQDFGDLINAATGISGTANSTRGIFNQGQISAGNLNTIEYVTIASTGNAQDFGDALNKYYTYNNSSSDSHGGLS